MRLSKNILFSEVRFAGSFVAFLLAFTLSLILSGGACGSPLSGGPGVAADMLRTGAARSADIYRYATERAGSAPTQGERDQWQRVADQARDQMLRDIADQQRNLQAQNARCGQGGCGNGNGNKGGGSQMPPMGGQPPPNKNSGNDNKQNNPASSPAAMPSLAPTSMATPPSNSDPNTSAQNQQFQKELASIQQTTKQTRDDSRTTLDQISQSRTAAASAQLNNSLQSQQNRLLATINSTTPTMAIGSQGNPGGISGKTQVASGAGNGGGTATGQTIAQALGGARKGSLGILPSGDPKDQKAPRATQSPAPGVGAADPSLRLLASVRGILPPEEGFDIVIDSHGRKVHKPKARAIRKILGTLSWGIRAAGEVATKWLVTRRPPRELMAALESGRPRILGSTRKHLNRVTRAVAETGGALRSRKDVLNWGSQPGRSREEAPPLPAFNVSITTNGNSGGIGVSGSFTGPGGVNPGGTGGHTGNAGSSPFGGDSLFGQ